MPVVLRFIFGLIFGSFLNVLAFRYNPERFLLAKSVIGGRSHCPHCHRTLTWVDLIPVISFLVLRGKCRTCREKISFQYPLVELLSGILFALPVKAPIDILGSNLLTGWASIWVAVLLGLLLMAIIDIRTQIIPDEFHVWFAFLGAASVYLQTISLSTDHSFLGGYALLFGSVGNFWLNHVLGALIGGTFFLVLIALTRGRGMGMGDAKLGASLGFLFGWPDISLVVILGFIFGAIYGVVSIIAGDNRLKSKVPFGPFLALGSLAVILFGESILRGYFGLFGL